MTVLLHATVGEVIGAATCHMLALYEDVAAATAVRALRTATLSVQQQGLRPMQTLPTKTGAQQSIFF